MSKKKKQKKVRIVSLPINNTGSYVEEKLSRKDRKITGFDAIKFNPLKKVKKRNLISLNIQNEITELQMVANKAGFLMDLRCGSHDESTVFNVCNGKIYWQAIIVDDELDHIRFKCRRCKRTWRKEEDK